MPLQQPASWRDLFDACESQNARTIANLKVIRRFGVPFLILPAAPRLAAKALALYPAQTRLARLMRGALGFALRMRLPLAPARFSVPIARTDAFAGFLAQVASVGDAAFPPFAVLAGNPRAEGQRFMVVLFDQAGAPAAAVKAGVSQSAIHLVERESAFLKSVPDQTPAIPRLRSTFRSERIQALALAFFPGRSPKLAETDKLETLLNAWLDCSRTSALAELGLWQRLERASTGISAAMSQLRQLGGAQVHPTLYHGDFVPWNIKVSPPTGDWTVLDWERGELAGIPGWDWFHYVIQTAVLVERESTAQLIRRIEQVLTGGPFARYAARARITGMERSLVLAYLRYCLDVTKQTEGISRVESLSRALFNRWFGPTG